jgi:hypothetical protein
MAFQWAAVPVADSGLTPDEYAAINSVVNAVESSTLGIDPALLVANREYLWRLQVTNWLGRSHAVTMTTFKARGAVPKIQFDDSAVRFVRKDEAFMAVVQLEASRCDPSQELLMSWTELSSHGFDLPAKYVNQVVLAQNKLFYIKANRFEAGRTYVFRLSVAVVDDLDLSNTADLTIHVARSPLVAGIAGGDRLQSISTAPGDVVLDASPSLDPDDPDAELAFEWSCAMKSRGQVCFSPQALADAGVSFEQSGDPLLVVPRALVQATVDMQVPNWDGEEEAYNFMVVVTTLWLS